MSQKVKGPQVERWAEHLAVLAQSDLQSALDVWRIINIMDHRGITSAHMAEYLDVSRQWVNACLNGKALMQRLPATRQRYIERLEDAVTALTDAKGGVPEACCSPAAYASTIVHVLQHTAQVEV